MKFDGMPEIRKLVLGSRAFPYEIGLDDVLHHAEYANYNMRLTSFRIRGEIDSRYSSEEFAHAGLFRTGEADECACFHCGNLICGWEYEDDPLEQHAKCSLNCSFVERERAKKKGLDFCAVLNEMTDDFAYDREYHRDDAMKTFVERLIKKGDDIARRNAEEVFLQTIADFTRKMPEEEFRYRPDPILSPGWAMIEDEPLQKRGSLKQVIQAGNICQLDEYCRDDCFEVWSTSQNDMKKKSVFKERYEKESLDVQNENVRKHQTDTSPRNADTGSAPEERDVQNEDVDEEIRALEQLLMCKVCLDKDSCIVFFPCRHMATCESCEQFLQRCPVCRSAINEAVKINEE